MDILKKLNILTLFILVGLTACGRNMDSLVKEPLDETINLIGSLEAWDQPLVTSDGGDLNLKDHNNKPTILLFSGEWCIVCQEEHKHIRDYFAEDATLRNKVNIYTVFIRVNQSKSHVLKGRWNIDWPVAYDPSPSKMELIHKYCGLEGLTPCAVVHSPTQGFVHQESGPFDKETFLRWTRLED
jgi:thioredoxin-related protein